MNPAAWTLCNGAFVLAYAEACASLGYDKAAVAILREFNAARKVG
jgi:hypothetical protein